MPDKKLIPKLLHTPLYDFTHPIYNNLVLQLLVTVGGSLTFIRLQGGDSNTSRAKRYICTPARWIRQPQGETFLHGIGAVCDGLQKRHRS